MEIFFLNLSLMRYTFITQHTMERWRYAFWVPIIAQMIAFFVFTIFGSAEIQEWNYYEENEEN